MNLHQPEQPSSPPRISPAWAWLALLAAWLLVRLTFWVGYTGADDQFYARYAWLMHRPPINHMEYRMPTVWSIRLSMLAFGPTEGAACLPPLLGSAAVLGAVAWLVRWPRVMNWKTSGAVALACLLPLDVGFATYPAPAMIAGGLLALGSVCVLRGGRWLGLLGACLFAAGFMTHEIVFYYIALFCFTALAFDWRRYWPAVAATVVISGLLVAAECTTYAFLSGNPLARVAELGIQGKAEGFASDTRAGGSVVKFFLMPLEILLLSKQFGVNLLVMTLGGCLAWRHLSVEQRIVAVSAFLYWFWLGYGSNVPWAYRPPSRGLHYYTPLALAACAIPPVVLGHLFAHRQRIGQAILASMLAVHAITLGLGGSWGQCADVSRELLRYVKAHPDQKFLADVYTMNEMYLFNRFELPENVICLNTAWLVGDLLENKEPEGKRNVRFDEPAGLAGILVNHERLPGQPEPEFVDFLEAHRGELLYQVPKRYRPAFVPIATFVGERAFMVRSQGGKVVVCDYDRGAGSTPAGLVPVEARFED